VLARGKTCQDVFTSRKSVVGGKNLLAKESRGGLAEERVSEPPNSKHRTRPLASPTLDPPCVCIVRLCMILWKSEEEGGRKNLVTLGKSCLGNEERCIKMEVG
jgi:hypothetical protein